MFFIFNPALGCYEKYTEWDEGRELKHIAYHDVVCWDRINSIQLINSFQLEKKEDKIRYRYVCCGDDDDVDNYCYNTDYDFSSNSTNNKNFTLHSLVFWFSSTKFF